MGIKLASTEELLSIAYASAVVAQAGAPCELITRDYGIDLSIRRIESFEHELIDMGVAFECQMKASIRHEIVDGQVVWDIKANDYNRLVRQARHSTTVVVLVLLCLPREPGDWLNLTDEELVLRKCCYWKDDFDDITSNTSSVTLKIPLHQRFTPDFVAMRVSAATRKLVRHGSDSG
jgi:hypothetical protein